MGITELHLTSAPRWVGPRQGVDRRWARWLLRLLAVVVGSPSWPAAGLLAVILCSPR